MAVKKQEYQSVGIRFAALLLDGIILLVVNLLIVLPVVGLGFFNILFAVVVFLPIIILIIVVDFLYFVLLEGLYGATIGKRAVGICVVREDGSKCTITDAFIRNLLRIVDGILCYLIGAILIWTSEKKQRIGDMAAHTIVVRSVDKVKR
ncbi:MAG: RDD family protein [Candidatus Aenigmatarchaeota archaeon]